MTCFSLTDLPNPLFSADGAGGDAPDPTVASEESSGNAGEPVDAAQPVSDDPMVTPSRSIRPFGLDDARKLAVAGARVAIDNNGTDVMILDVSKQSAEFDFFVIATGTSRRQLHAISEQIDDVLEKELGDRRAGIEGYQESSWIVLDYGSVVVHLFDEETREYYDLESLWADATKLDLASLGLEQRM